MSVPAWAQERPPAGRPLTVFGPPGGRGRSGSQGRGPSAKRVDTSPRRDRAKLGRTSGLFAAGAWSAREEIARMIENGVPSNEILEAIRSGSEGDQPLEIQGESEQADEPVAKSLSEERPPRSSGVVPPSWTTEKKAEKPAKYPPAQRALPQQLRRPTFPRTAPPGILPPGRQERHSRLWASQRRRCHQLLKFRSCESKRRSLRRNLSHRQLCQSWIQVGSPRAWMK